MLSILIGMTKPFTRYVGNAPQPPSDWAFNDVEMVYKIKIITSFHSEDKQT